MNTHEYWVDAWVVAIMSKYTSSFTHRLQDENNAKMMRELKVASEDPVLQKALVAEKDLTYTYPYEELEGAGEDF